MKSVADDLRRETRDAVLRLSADERMSLALRLGDEDVAMLIAMHGAGREAVLARIRRLRAVGRFPSRAHDSEPA